MLSARPFYRTLTPPKPNPPHATCHLFYCVSGGEGAVAAQQATRAAEAEGWKAHSVQTLHEGDAFAEKGLLLCGSAGTWYAVSSSRCAASNTLSSGR